MSNKTPDKFSLFVPDEQEPERFMPERLELDDYMATTVTLPAGTYDPYESASGATTQVRRPRPQDLRKLSEWIKTRRTVEELARENADPDPKSRR